MRRQPTNPSPPSAASNSGSAAGTGIGAALVAVNVKLVADASPSGIVKDRSSINPTASENAAVTTELGSPPLLNRTVR